MLVLDGDEPFVGPRILDLRSEAAERLGLGDHRGKVGARERARLVARRRAGRMRAPGAGSSSRGRRRRQSSPCPRERLPRLTAHPGLRAPAADPAALLDARRATWLGVPAAARLGSLRRAGSRLLGALGGLTPASSASFTDWRVCTCVDREPRSSTTRRAGARVDQRVRRASAVPARRRSSRRRSCQNAPSKRRLRRVALTGRGQDVARRTRPSPPCACGTCSEKSRPGATRPQVDAGRTWCDRDDVFARPAPRGSHVPTSRYRPRRRSALFPAAQPNGSVASSAARPRSSSRDVRPAQPGERGVRLRRFTGRRSGAGPGPAASARRHAASADHAGEHARACHHRARAEQLVAADPGQQRAAGAGPIRSVEVSVAGPEEPVPASAAVPPGRRCPARP